MVKLSYYNWEVILHCITTDARDRGVDIGLFYELDELEYKNKESTYYSCIYYGLLLIYASPISKYFDISRVKNLNSL